MASSQNLETERLVLSPFAPQDIDRLLAVFRDTEVRRFLLDGAEVPRQWVEEEIAASGERFAGAAAGERTAGIWTIRLNDESKIVGFAGFRPFFHPPRLQLIYGLLPMVWRRGLAIEAACAVCDYGFDVLGFERIEAAIDVPNIASGRVLNRLGMELVRTTDEGEFGGTSYFMLRRST